MMIMILSTVLNNELKNLKISVVLPCRNEEGALGDCLRTIKKVLADNSLTGEIIVSDSSSDHCPEIARDFGAIVVKHDLVGYGRAYLEGFKHLTGDIIIMGDPDGSYDFREIPNFLKALSDKDLVIGSRFRGNIAKGAMPWSHRYVGSPLILSLMRHLYGLELTEPSTGFVAIRRLALEKLVLRQPGMEFASEFLAEAKKRGLRIGEFAIDYRLRQGASKLHTLRDGFRHLSFLVGRWIKN